MRIAYLFLLAIPCVAAAEVGITTTAFPVSSAFQANQGSGTRWFDEAANAEGRSALSLHLGANNQFRFRLEQNQGVQSGRVGKYECLFTGCMWVPSKAITGIDAAESIAWRFDHLASEYAHPLPISGVDIRLLGRFDLYYGKMIAHAASESWRIQGPLPAVGVGISITQPLSPRWGLQASAGYSGLRFGGVRLSQRTQQLELQYRFDQAITLAAGYQQEGFDLEYAREDIHAALALDRESPYFSARFAF